MTPATVRANAEGMFRACALHPGEYRLMASKSALGDTMAERMSGWAATALAWGSAFVLDKDVRGLRLTEQPPVAVEGDAVYDPEPRAKSGPVQISVSRYVAAGGYADSTDNSSISGMVGGFIGGGGTTVPGPFSLGRLRSGEWRVEVHRLPAGCYVKAITYGSQNLLRELLRVGGDGVGERVHLTIACDGGSLTARVDDASGKPVASGILFVYDADARTPGEMALNLRRIAVSSGWSA